MGSNPISNDPKAIWQNQPTQSAEQMSKVTLVLMQQKARALRAKTRQELFNNVLGHLTILIFCGIGIARSRDVGQRWAFAVAVAWSLVAAFASRRGMRVQPMPGDAAFETGIAFYRQEIQRRRLLFRRSLAWYLGPILLAIGALVTPVLRTALATDPRHLRNAIPFVAVLAIWFILLWVSWRRRKRDLERELGELDEIEQETR